MIRCLWASSDTDVYVGGWNALLHSRGDGVWENQFPSDLVIRDGGGQYIVGMWGFGTNAVYAVSATGMLFRSGGDGRWVTQQLPLTAIDDSGDSPIWGLAADDVYIFGDALIHGTSM
jgi:hypothetical protein